MEFDNLLKLVECVSRSGLSSFYYEQGGTKIRLKKDKRNEKAAGKAPEEAEESQAAAAPESVSDISGREIKSPLVGIFYEAPGEGAPPFASVGDRVKKGQTLGIVEAMKLMNEIESEYDGVVVKIPVRNGQSVEYGQTLFVIADEG